MATLQGNVGLPGASAAAGGTGVVARLLQLLALPVAETNGVLYQPNYDGKLFTFGLSNTALVAANAIATGVTATAQPVLGLYNPANSGKNLEIRRAIVNTTTVANTAVSPGGFMWLANAAPGTISTGSTPINLKSLSAAGSVAKVFAISTALTGMTGSLTVLRASPIQSINAAGAATAVTLTTSPSEELVEGSIIVPPGMVVALMNQVSTTTISVGVGLTWAEEPV